MDEKKQAKGARVTITLPREDFERLERCQSWWGEERRAGNIARALLGRSLEAYENIVLSGRVDVATFYDVLQSLGRPDEGLALHSDRERLAGRHEQAEELARLSAEATTAARRLECEMRKDLAAAELARAHRRLRTERADGVPARRSSLAEA